MQCSSAAKANLRHIVRTVAIALLVGAGLSTHAASPEPVRAAATSMVAEGVLEIIVEDHPNASVTRHFLKTATGRLELKLAGSVPASWRAGSTLRLRGQQSGQTLALTTSDSASATTIATAPMPNTSGEQKVAVLLVNFADDTSQPYTVAQANDVVFNQTSAFMRENSFQLTWLAGNTFGWFTLPMAKTCLTSDIAAAAKQAAASAGVNLAAYGRFVYVFPPNMNCGWSGVGTVGGTPSDAWINGTADLKVVAHEFGHNLGLQHSHSSDCDATPLGANCTTYEYGDVADVMGNVTASHFSASQKERLGWLNNGLQPAIATASASGSFAIGAYEAAVSAVKALKVLKSTNAATGAQTWYYIEYRRPTGFDAPLSTLYASNLVSGVLVRTSTDGDRNSSYLLDMTPNTVPTFDLGDAALVPGQAFTDSAAGVTISVTAIDANQATVNVTLGASSGCVRAYPSVAIAGGSTSVPSGSMVNYSVSVTNKDASGCDASQFNLQSTLPAGFSASLANPALSLVPGATATTTMSVSSAAGMSAGSYAVGVKAANTSSPANTGSASALYSVAATTLATMVSTGSALYHANDTVALSASVKAGGVSVANSAVSFKIVKSDGSAVLLSGTTSASGIASASYRVSRKDAKGTWQVQESASYLGTAASAATSFAVQ